MIRKLFHNLRTFDWYLIINILLLMFFGLAALYSLQINVISPDFTLFLHQAVFLAVGLLIFFLVSLVNFHFWSDYYKIILFLSLLLLIGVLIVGVKIGGTTGWYNLAGQSFQPVELAKLALVIFLSKYFSQHAKEAGLTKYLIISGLVTGLLVFLVILQPDLGSAIILLATWLVLVMLLPLRRKYFIGMFIILILLMIISWFFILRDYQQERILTFLSPQRDPLGTGYNVTQSIIAVGSGRFFGRGLALGSQSQLNFLPTQETDFIFAVIAEELGILGAGILLLLFLSLFGHLYSIVKTTTDSFGVFLTLGIITFLIIQLFVNIGMNMGVAPVAGLPLPLVSYGGSSLVTTLMALGIVHNIYLKNREKDYG